MNNSSSPHLRKPRFPDGIPPMLPQLINGPATTVTEELGVKPKRKRESSKKDHVEKAQAELNAFEDSWNKGSGKGDK